jgi:hypothetical protein
MTQNNFINYWFILLFLCQCFFVKATTTTGDTLTSSNHKKSIGVIFGTNGVGVEINYLLPRNEKVGLRLTGAYIGYQKQNTVKLNPKSSLVIDPDISFGQILLAGTYSPFKKRVFSIVAGVAYLYNFKLAAFANTDTGLDFSGTQIAAEDFGHVNLEIKWNKIAPYVGFAFGRVVPRKRVGLGVEMGCYYLGHPHIQTDYTGVLEITNVDEVIPQIEKNITNYSFLPSINFKVRYRL